jgi:hypothetical protein
MWLSIGRRAGESTVVSRHDAKGDKAAGGDARGSPILKAQVFVNQRALAWDRERVIMAGLSVKRFNWLRSPSAWQSTQAWRERQQAARENFEAANSAASSTFAAASTNLVTGLGSIAATIAAQRAQQQAQQAQQQAQQQAVANALNALA